MWSPIQTVGKLAAGDDYGNREDAPISRCKHSTCTTSDGHIYLFGGKSGNLPLKDLWRLDPGKNKLMLFAIIYLLTICVFF